MTLVFSSKAYSVTPVLLSVCLSVCLSACTTDLSGHISSISAHFQFLFTFSATIKDTLRLSDLPGQVLELNPSDYPAFEVCYRYLICCSAWSHVALYGLMLHCMVS